MNQETQKLSQLLTQETLLATSLLDLMLQEQKAMEESSYETLHSLTTKKANCLDQIEEISRLRTQLLLGLSTAPTTVLRMNEYINKQEPSQRRALKSLVDKLELSLEDCRRQNSVNGMIISMSQRNVQRNLNIIKGADQVSMTYTDKGQTTNVGIKHGGLKV